MTGPTAWSELPFKRIKSRCINIVFCPLCRATECGSSPMDRGVGYRCAQARSQRPGNRLAHHGRSMTLLRTPRIPTQARDADGQARVAIVALGIALVVAP